MYMAATTRWWHGTLSGNCSTCKGLKAAIRENRQNPCSFSLRHAEHWITFHTERHHLLSIFRFTQKERGERAREREKTRKRTIASWERETRKRVTSIERHTETARRYARIDNITYRAFGCLLIYRADQRVRVVAIVWKADRKLLLSATTRTAHRTVWYVPLLPLDNSFDLLGGSLLAIVPDSNFCIPTTATHGSINPFDLSVIWFINY